MDLFSLSALYNQVVKSLKSLKSNDFIDLEYFTKVKVTVTIFVCSLSASDIAEAL